MPPALFVPFRALGYITDDVPFAVQRRGRETFVTVSVGKSWQVYNCSRFRLSLVGPQVEHRTLALACKGDLTFLAVGHEIVVCQRVHRVGTFSGHQADVTQLLCLGERLLSLGNDHKVAVWKLNDYDSPEALLELGSSFEATCMAHPDTYLDKVIVGSADGRLQLWNFSSNSKLHEFQVGQGTAICCLVPSPALDVVGIGLADGQAILQNIRYDEEVARFANAAGVGVDSPSLLPRRQLNRKSRIRAGACSAISFSTVSGALLAGGGVPLMAAGGASGAITVWNLEAKRLHTIIRDAHDARLTSLHFFPGEPRLMSAAADNTLKQWVFDKADGSARLLRFRSGHAAPPTVVQYYGVEGTRLLSAGQDRALRLFSVIQDQQSRELSQRHVQRRAKRLRVDPEELKLPQLTAVAACQARERDWCNVVTAHEGDPAAYTWRLQHFVLGEHILKPPQLPGDATLDPVSAVAMSPCGNYAAVGSSGGRLDRYNMQSGQHRGLYCRASSTVATTGAPAHNGAITGIAVDATNTCMVSVGLDAELCLWHFRALGLREQVQLRAPASRLAHHAGSNLVAVACDDLGIYMYDVAAARLVRRFLGHEDRITDLAISGDAVWLLSASMDGTLRVYDIPAAHTLQVLRLGAPIVAFSLSPNQELLATVHVNHRGIYLWANQTIFGQDAADVMPSDSPIDARLPQLDAEALEEEASDSASDADFDPSADSDTASLSDDASQLSEEPALPEAAATAAAARSTDSENSSSSFYDAARQLPVRSPGDVQDAEVAPEEPPADLPLSLRPFAPELVMLSMLPASHWQSMLHLDAIKERNRPAEPPQQPAKAPFFLPTIPSLSGQPQFAPAAASQAGAGADAPVSRVSRGALAPGSVPAGTLVTALRAEDGFQTAMALLAELSPLDLDTQLRAMQVVEGGDRRLVRRQLKDLVLLLDLMSATLTAGTNFDLLQGVLALTLQLHGPTLSRHARLRMHAAALRTALDKVWARRLEPLLQGTRCMLGYLNGSVA